MLTAILNNEDKRKEFVEAIENLVYHKRKIEADMLLHKEDVAAVSVRFGLSKGLLNKKVTAIVKEKETEGFSKQVEENGLAGVIAANIFFQAMLEELDNLGD